MKNWKKKLLSFALVFVMAVALQPTTAFAATTRTWNGRTFTEWTSNNSLPSSGTYYLNTDVEMNSKVVTLNGNLSLDLNGHTITFTGNNNNAAFIINGNYGFDLYDSVGGGKIEEAANASGYHRAVWVDSTNAYFYMHGGTISGFHKDTKGSGVCVNVGKMIMDDGEICNNTTTKDGGAVMVEHAGTFEMKGGKIHDNTCDWTGGGIASGGGTVNISGGEIYNNKSTSTSTDNYGGGGIGGWDGAKFTVSGTAKIYNNNANVGGAVVLIRNATLTMNGGEIGSNTATKSYSGVGGFASGSNSGYSITYTSGRAYTGNGYTKTPSATSTITFDRNGGTGGTSSITGQNWNVAMKSITLPTREGYTFLGYFDATSGGTQYYNANGTSTRNWDYFGVSKTLYAQWRQHTTRCGITAGWQEWTSTNSLPTNGGHYYLAKDVTVSSTWTVPSGATYLDLNGHTVQRSSAGVLVQINNGSVFELYDESKTQYRFKSVAYNNDGRFYWTRDNSGAYSLTGGCLLGNGVGSYGKGALVTISSGTFRMHGGNIVGVCNTEYWGYGGVFIGTNCTFDMSGGTIAGCYARCGGGLGGDHDGDNPGQADVLISGDAAITYCSAEHGGGMFIRSGIVFKMTGGSITHCFASGHGGGVNWKGTKGAYFLGGEITQNSAQDYGGGIGNEVNDTFVFGGTMKVYENTAKGQTDNYYPMVVCPLVIGTGENAPRMA